MHHFFRHFRHKLEEVQMERQAHGLFDNMGQFRSRAALKQHPQHEHRHDRIKPKLSSPALLPLRTAATPTPSAMMNGTVMGPVVAPPASKAMPRNDGLVKKAQTNTSA